MTVSLANGKSETWVTDRTGHKSSQMVRRYKREVRKLEELALGDFTPLHLAIPELRRHDDGPDEKTESCRTVYRSCSEKTTPPSW